MERKYTTKLGRITEINEQLTTLERDLAAAREQRDELRDQVRRLRWWLERVTLVEGADDAGSGVWMCALRAKAGLEGQPIKDDAAIASQPSPRA